MKGNEEYFINLGEVEVISNVRLNGEKIGGTWIRPHILNTKSLLKNGNNKIEIEVVNLWRNRMIRDKYLPPDDKKSWWIIDDIKPGEQLQPSGLIGPVTIEKLSNENCLSRISK